MSLIKSGGGTGPVKSRQPARMCKVLIPVDEKKNLRLSVGDFLMKGKKNYGKQKDAFYIRIGN